MNRLLSHLPSQTLVSNTTYRCHAFLFLSLNRLPRPVKFARLLPDSSPSHHSPKPGHLWRACADVIRASPEEFDVLPQRRWSRFFLLLNAVHYEKFAILEAGSTGLDFAIDE